ncbi:MAG: mitomycin antibiotic biosynthesis protein [Candidatus Latescibacteria bacterium]|jgi:phytanoyl-CoA hydroxylase|nr:mitomycin antibiotic biosynthesis protein [Candidatus Latescibacterota bacterium]MBT4138769.1 mitomycin antibiotic biosynthesis protein [Candidatus Latescibacterota bacterium]
MSVTKEHLDFYEEEGYVIIEGGLTDSDLEPIIQGHNLIVDQIAHDLYKQGKIKDLYPNEPFDQRLACLANECPEVEGCPDIGETRQPNTFEFIRNENLVNLIEAFVGPEITCNAVSHIRPKMPSTDVIFHQDAVFTTQEAKDILQVTVWIPLVEATEENGCLQVLPRIHQQRVLYWSYDKDLPQVEPVTLPMKKGDVLFMHKLTPHGSGPNNTNAVRWSLDLRYQKTNDPSPRPEWPSLIARSHQDPTSETTYENWRDQWATALKKIPTKIRYERPSKPLPFTGQMYLTD